MTNLNNHPELPDMLSVRDLLEALIIVEARRQAMPPPTSLTAASLSSPTITPTPTASILTVTTTNDHATAHVPSTLDDEYNNLSGSEPNDITPPINVNNAPLANTNDTAPTGPERLDETIAVVTLESIPLRPLADYVHAPEGLDVNVEQWYVVSKGTSVGVFYDWNYVSPLVTGKKGAVYTKASSFANACLAFARNYEMGKVSIIP